MTIENNLERIATALESIAASLNQKGANATPIPVQAQPAPVAAPVVAAPVMPPAPVFTPAVPVATPAPAPVVSTGPAAFASKQEMTDFVISSYKALGPEKGAKIQQVLEGMGFKNINDCPPESWAQLKSGIEALKG